MWLNSYKIVATKNDAVLFVFNGSYYMFYWVQSHLLLKEYSLVDLPNIAFCYHTRCMEI